MKSAYVLLFDGYADWEIGHVLAELRRLGQVEVTTTGFSDAPVTSMGGLTVRPDMALSAVGIHDVLIFILPGGYLWEQAYPKKRIDPFLQRLESNTIPVAGICAATTVLAKAGLLEGRRHTSNSKTYMDKHVPGYSGHADYVNAPAVTDRNVVTATGLDAVEFTMEILTLLDIATPEIRQIWYEAFKHGNFPEDFDPHAS